MNSSKIRALADQFDELAAGLEELAEDLFDEPASVEPAPTHVGDIVEIIALMSGTDVHVGKRATVVEEGVEQITVLLPEKFGHESWLRGGQPHWYLESGVYRVVARLVTDEYGNRSYDYVEVS